MLRLTFTEEEVKELHYQRYHHPHPRVQMKMEAVLLKAKGVPHHQIASCVGVCENTVRSYLEQYQTGGIEALKQLQFTVPPASWRRITARWKRISETIRQPPSLKPSSSLSSSPDSNGTQRKSASFSKRWASSASRRMLSRPNSMPNSKKRLKT